MEIIKNKELNETVEDLKFKYQSEINKNKELNKEIETLKNTLSNEIKKNDDYSEINNKLSIELNNLKKKCIELENNIVKNKNLNNNEKIVELYGKIEDYREKLSRYPFELLKNEEIISVIFTSDDQKIHCSILCKNTETFNRIEERLYKEYPEYSMGDNYFVVNGRIVVKFQTLEENKIKNSDIIMLNQRKD